MAATALFEPLQVGNYTLDHRVVLAPLTRCRTSAVEGDDESLPTDIMAKYYGQRASRGGLLIAEASPISPEARPDIMAPSIYTPLHAERWKPVTDAVHAKGGFIFLQMWHVGAWSHSGLDSKGRPPLSSAVLDMEAGTSLFNTRDGLKPRDPQTRMLTTEEIPELIEQYVRAAKLSIEAGFDGVEIHGANGYLLDQFVSDHINSQRTDQYGGSLENRLRLPVEIMTAVANAIGGGRTGIRFSPYVWIQGKQDSDPILTWTTLLKKLNPLNLAYVHMIEPRPSGPAGSLDRAAYPDEPDLKPFREAYDGVLIVAGGHSAETAEAAVKNGDADLVAFGRSFISNPDLPSRIQHGHPFSPSDRTTFYTQGEEGYTDYKTWEELEAEKHDAAASDEVSS